MTRVPPERWPDSAPRSGPATLHPEPGERVWSQLLLAVALAAFVVTVWDLLDGFLHVVLFVFVEITLWAIAALLWLGSIIDTTSGTRRRSGSLRLRGWAILPLLVVVTVAIIGSGLLVHARFWLSQPWLDEVADRLEAESRPSFAGGVGLFSVEDAWVWEGVYLDIGQAGFLDDITLARDAGPGVCSSEMALDDRWSLCLIVY